MFCVFLVVFLVPSESQMNVLCVFLWCLWCFLFPNSLDEYFIMNPGSLHKFKGSLLERPFFFRTSMFHQQSPGIIFLTVGWMYRDYDQ